MTTNSQKRSLRLWHKVLLRLTLPFVWIFFIFATSLTLAFLVIPCTIAAFISWVIFGDIHFNYTMIWCVLPICIGICYSDWLKEKDVIRPC